MIRQQDRSSAKLRQWLADSLGMRTVLATGPAPVYARGAEDSALSARLERLDRSVGIEELTFAADALFAQAAEPEALRLLRRHEGLAPACPGVLRPDSPQALERLLDIAANCGLSVAWGPARQDLFPHPKDALAVSMERMSSVKITDTEAGIVTIDRGATWQDVEKADETRSLGIPHDITPLFPAPADAAEAGLFAARGLDPVRGVPCRYELALPASGTRYLDGTWLFRDADKAHAAFKAVCRKVPPFYACLFGEADLRLGEKIGLWRLPNRPFADNAFTGLRLIYAGGPAATRAMRFLSTFSVETRGGKFWRNGPLLTASDRVGVVLENGLSEITVRAPGLGTELSGQADRLRAAICEESGQLSVKPIRSARNSFCNGRFDSEISLLFPRNFTDPVSQWQSIAAAGTDGGSAGQSSDKQGGSDDDLDGPTGESVEWQAIRAALLPNGQPAPASSAASGTYSTAPAPSPNQA